MKKIFLSGLIVSAFAFLFSVPVFAQKNKADSRLAQNYVISAKAGGINYVEGAVTVLRKNGTSGYLLKSDNLEVGDKVTTGAGGKVEILLNPGSYVRLAGNSEFEFVTTSLNDLKLQLNRGSAMLEVFADDDFRVIVNTPTAQFYAVKSGVYRIDVLGGGQAKIEVWDGKAQVGDAAASVVKSGREAVVGGDRVAVAKFDRDEKDPLEMWSKTRAKELAKINSQLERKILRDTLVSSFRSNTWNMYNSFGLWVADASFSGYCFLPFGRDWYSPYGYSFGWNLWNMGLPTYIYNQPPTWINNGGNGNPNNGNNSPTKDRDVAVRESIAPPFEQIRNSGGVTTRKMDPAIDADTSTPFPSGQSTMPTTVVRPTTPTKSATRNEDN
jgi:hypothetical protein